MTTGGLPGPNECVDLDPPICLIKYPLKAGQTWGGRDRRSAGSR